MERVVVYTAFGKAYTDAVKESVRSLRGITEGDVEEYIIIFTDKAGEEELKDFNKQFRINVWLMQKEDRRASIINLGLIPKGYDYVLAVDADTIFKKDYRDAWGLLEKFDVAMTHEPARYVKEKEEYYRVNPDYLLIPKSFPEFNSGVIFFRNTRKVCEVFAVWYMNYLTQAITEGIYAPLDQAPLRYAIWGSNLRIATLPPEFNVTPGMGKIMYDYPAAWNIKPIIEHNCIGFKSHEGKE